MRRRTITFVVLGLVLALFVVPAAASALIGQETVEETVPEVVEGLAWDYFTGPHVVWYAHPSSENEEPDCELADGVSPKVDEEGELVYDEDDNLVFVDGDGEDLTLPDLDEACRAVLIEGPNGQVNHGQFVSNMVHDLKDGYDKEDGPFGQWVKKFAQDDAIGKGDLKVKPDKDGDLELLKAAELDDDGDDDGDGPPAHANANSKKNK